MSRRRKNALLQRVEYLFYRAVARAVRTASNEAIRRWGTRLGNLARRVLRGRDRLAMRNLAETFSGRSEAERRRILVGKSHHLQPDRHRIDLEHWQRGGRRTD